jgi:hypothetical protein
MIRYIGAGSNNIHQSLDGLVGLFGVDRCGGGFRGFALLAILANETVVGAIYAGLTCEIINVVCCIIGACGRARGANVVHAFCAGREVGAARKIILRHSGTIEMGTGGEGAANAKDNSKGQDGPFELFHTKLFLVITIE